MHFGWRSLNVKTPSATVVTGWRADGGALTAMGMLLLQLASERLSDARDRDCDRDCWRDAAWPKLCLRNGYEWSVS